MSSSSALLLLAAAFPLAAQEPDTTARDTVRLPPVTVAAARHQQDLFAVPLAVTQVRPRDLFGARGYGLDEALTLVPGVLAQSRYGSSDVRLVVRGFGARGAGDRSNAGTSRGVRVLLDGFPETEPDGRTSFDGIDLAAAHAIEVIRSNASALWGNAAGGVVSISTVPDADAPAMALEGMAGAFGLRRWAAITHSPVGAGKLAATFVHTDFDGWRTHSGSERSLLNASLRTPVGAGTQLGVFALATFNLFRVPGPLDSAQAATDPRQANPTYLLRDERRHNRVGRLGVTLDHEWGDARELSASVYVNPKFLQRSERGTFRDFTRYHVGGNIVFRTRMAFGESVAGTLVVGGDQAYQDGAILFYSLTPAGTRGDTVRADKREGALNMGAFLQEELAFGARWLLTLGARFDDISYYYQDFLDPKLDADKAFRGVTPKLGLTFRPSPAHSLYASVGGGIEAPAGNETDPAGTFGQDTVTLINPLLDPIRSTTYELGTRQAVRFDRGPLRGLSYDLALYHTRVRNEIVPYQGGRFYFTAASARRSGVELGLSLQGTGAITLQTALAYQHHRYGRYVVDSVHYRNPGRFADYSGNRVVGVPEFTYGASLDVAPRALLPLRLRLGLQGTSSYFADDANQVRVAAYRTASITVGIDDPVAVGGGLSIRGFATVSNLFDADYIASAFLNPDVVGGVPVAFEPGLPRSLVVGVTLARGSRRAPSARAELHRRVIQAGPGRHS
jgi:iron complex outermembrane receptor protein